MAHRATRHFLALPLALVMLAASPSATAHAERVVPTVDLSADASRAAPNDMAIASLYFEADGADPAPLARQVNAVIASALEQARLYPAVKARSSGTSTFPVYGKEGRKIEGWRMRSEIQLESRDLPALSELLGKLQGKLALSGLLMQPAPETRRSVADLAAGDAIRAFQARADAVAATLGKPYRIRHLSIGYGGESPPIRPMMKTTTFAAEAAPAAIEAGESEIAVTVSGTIELSE
ncbi:SIMPL domain-containing protein [Aromatoleum bremense]|uniref:DUF541 domain-containing protein n=1 Tax=Aromatoleum bremense TaxID=76115 RepID=A0ABX1NWD9_9RHOO|nr:SIMPL domain-containing protein [Aromatoleum bremense]NMG15967.1 DUF541 domain-containing protein [Aromatoleum bremense]QTQ33717.1 putative protein DUf541 [Aromatoleum bremense]